MGGDRPLLDARAGLRSILGLDVLFDAGERKGQEEWKLPPGCQMKTVMIARMVDE